MTVLSYDIFRPIEVFDTRSQLPAQLAEAALNQTIGYPPVGGAS